MNLFSVAILALTAATVNALPVALDYVRLAALDGSSPRRQSELPAHPLITLSVTAAPEAAPAAAQHKKREAFWSEAITSFSTATVPAVIGGATQGANNTISDEVNEKECRDGDLASDLPVCNKDAGY